MASNPIEQRMELLVEKWEDYKNNPGASLLCFRCQPDEVDMLDTFYTYMIASDTPIYDIAFHFDSICYDAEEFSTALLNELSETMEIWNNSEKDERITFHAIDWQADVNIASKKNPALLFVENFNRLAHKLELEESLNVVAIFKTGNKTKEFKQWLELAIKTGIAKNVRYVIDDTVENRFFDELKIFKKEVVFIPVNLNMPAALEQTAAMGDPKDPATGYRGAFIKMMNAMGESKEKEAEQAGHTCLRIAEENLEKDPYWSTQLVTVYTALATDKIKHKKTNEALNYSTKAVETAIILQGYIDNAMATLLQAQSQMFRGTLLFTIKKYEDAQTDFNDAFSIYVKQGQLALSIEAARMGAESAFKAGNKKEGKQLIAKGIQQGRFLDEETVYASTYAPVVKFYLEEYDQVYESLISKREVEILAKTLYGDDWMQKIKNWNKITEQQLQTTLSE